MSAPSASLNIVGYPLAGIGGHGWVTSFVLADCDAHNIRYSFRIDPLWTSQNPEWSSTQVLEYEQRVSNAGFNKHSPTLFLLNWGRMLALADEKLLHPLLSRSCNLCYGWWELDVVPDYLLKLSLFVDIILAPTRYIEKVARQAFPCSSVLYAPLPYNEIYEQLAASRIFEWSRRSAILQKLSYQTLLNKFESVSLVVANFSSCIERKNPHAAISCFCHHLLQNHLLVVKTANGNCYPNELAQLIKSASGQPNILLLDVHLSDLEMAELLSCCDIYISPHRAEGLGISLLLSDAAGLSSVITNYGGMLDYNPRGPGLHLRVAWTPKPVRSALYEPLIHPQSCTWADVNSLDLLRSVMACIAYEKHPNREQLARELEGLSRSLHDPLSIAPIVTRSLHPRSARFLALLLPMRPLLRYGLSKLFRVLQRFVHLPLFARYFRRS